MLLKRLFLVLVLGMLSAPVVYADACGSINQEIQELQTAIGHIKEHGEITPEDAKEVRRDLKAAKKDLQAVLDSGEAPGEEADMIKKAIAALNDVLKGLKKNDMGQVVSGLEQMVAVMMQYRDHHKCG